MTHLTSKRVNKMYQENMRKISSIKHYKLPLLMALSFIIGCTITINMTPIDKTCQRENSHREYSITHNMKLNNPELIVVILSAPKNLYRRSTIRETWLQLAEDQDEHIKKFKMKYYFVIGSYGLDADQILHLSSEQSRYNDLMIVPMYDSYSNLTEKLLKTFQWLDEQHELGLGFKYVLKCDDDSFVRADVLSAELRNMETLYLHTKPKDILKLNEDRGSAFVRLNAQINTNAEEIELGLYWGYFNGNAKIKTAGKWMEPDWIVCDKYIPYALGGGYVLSKKLVSYIAKNAENLRRFRSEDVSVGLWLAPVTDILRIHDVRFDTEWTSRGCQNFYFVTHNISTNAMRKMYKNILHSKNLCEVQAVQRHFYLYDWSSAPSQCCNIKRNIQ